MPERDRTSVLHLLWAVPTIAALEVVPYFVAAISLCGISGCSGAGFGVTYSLTGLAFLLCPLMGFLAGIILWFVPWTPNRILHRRVSVGVAALITVTLAIWFADAIVQHR